jgi:hypothetical protein
MRGVFKAVALLDQSRVNSFIFLCTQLSLAATTKSVATQTSVRTSRRETARDLANLRKWGRPGFFSLLGQLWRLEMQGAAGHSACCRANNLSELATVSKKLHA